MILVTGGSGFVGRHLSAFVALQGKGPVRVLARRPERVFADADETLATALETAGRMAAAGAIDTPQHEAVRERAAHGADLLRDAVEPVPVDIRDPAGLREALSGVEAVVHAVAIIRETGGGSFAATNIEGTRNLVDAMRETGRPPSRVPRCPWRRPRPAPALQPLQVRVRSARRGQRPHVDSRQAVPGARLQRRLLPARAPRSRLLQAVRRSPERRANALPAPLDRRPGPHPLGMRRGRLDGRKNV